MIVDRSHGYEAIAGTFNAVRSCVGVDVVRRWAKRLPRGGEVVDVGCGSGAPVSQALMDEGLKVSGIDASPTLISMFHQRFPDAPWACEQAESSNYFGRCFDGATAIGLLFLLPQDSQRDVVFRISQRLRSGGRFLFSAPLKACSWSDTLTGRSSISLGDDGYRDLLKEAGMRIWSAEGDEGGNHYMDAVKEAD